MIDFPNDTSLFAGSELFANVDPDTVQPYLQQGEYRNLQAGEVVISPESDNFHIYLVLSGRLNVHLKSLQSPPLTALDPGACAGDMSILSPDRPSAYVVAVEPSKLFAMHHETVWTLLNVSHAFARNLFAVLSKRLRANNDLLVDSALMMKMLHRDSITDSLTDLPNRRWIQRMFRREMHRCTVNGRPVCLLLLDIDNFSTVNNEYGHLSGDRALCAVADSLRECLRPTDMLARYGGDEFAVLLPDTDQQLALAVAERVRSSVSRDAVFSPRAGTALNLSVSVGVAERGDGDSLEALLDRADAAMYRAKAKGRNRIAT